MKHVEFYRNDKDGSVLVSVGTQVPEKLIYAGQELTHLVADTVDAAKEKHSNRLSRKSMVIWKSTSAQ